MNFYAALLAFALMVVSLVAAVPVPQPGGWLKHNEHHVIHVPYTVKHVHHHHVKKVPVYIKSSGWTPSYSSGWSPSYSSGWAPASSGWSSSDWW